MIRERVRAGLARAKKAGRPWIKDPKLAAQVMRLRADKVGMVAIGKQLGVGTAYVQRIVRANAAPT